MPRVIGMSSTIQSACRVFARVDRSPAGTEILLVGASLRESSLVHAYGLLYSLGFGRLSNFIRFWISAGAHSAPLLLECIS